VIYAIRSTIYAILALRLLSELHQEFYQPLNVAYIDIKAAFDSVDRAAWKALRSSGAPPFLIQLIEHLHTGTTSRVRVGGQLSEPFETTSGVRQGCVLAPALFYPAVQVPRAPQSVPRNSRTTIMLMMPCYSLTVLLSGRTYCQASMKLHIRWV